MFKEMLVDLLYPGRCPICDAVLHPHDDMICTCHGSLPYVKEPCCMKCGKEICDAEQVFCQDCMRNERNFVRGYPVFNYIEPVKTSILSVKYKNKREYCDFFAREMARRLKPHIKKLGIDVIVPVPMHSDKKRRRGFNQAEILAEKLGKLLFVPVCSDMLVRERRTAPQKNLDNLERANNIKNSIKINEKRYNTDKIKNVLIVDDIYTTGVTVAACADRLLAAGVKNVYFTSVCIGKGR